MNAAMQFAPLLVCFKQLLASKFVPRAGQTVRSLCTDDLNLGYRPPPILVLSQIIITNNARKLLT